MTDNPFNMDGITIEVDETYQIGTNEDIEVKFDFEPSLIYIYYNTTTGTYVEFELDGVDDSFSVEEAIEAFKKVVVNLGLPEATPLPKIVLVLLEDEELDLFLLAHANEHYLKKIEDMISIKKANDYYTDKYGFVYTIEGVNKNDALLSYSENAQYITFHVKPEDIAQQGGVFYNCVRKFSV